jgi:hypothetical protein
MIHKPFEIAERYIQLRKRYASESWGDYVLVFNEMILGPLITLFLMFIGGSDMMMVISTSTHAYTTWCEWEEYHTLRSVVQEMFLTMSIHGGPQITTNDLEYLPYVFADAMVRLG